MLGRSAKTDSTTKKISLNTKALAIQSQYWEERLSRFEVSPLLSKQVTFKITEVEASAHRLNFEITPELHNRIQAFCHDIEVSIYIFYLSAFYLLQSRYLQKNDIVIGTIASSLNIIPLRQKIAVEKSFEHLLQEVWKNNQIDFEHADLPYEKISKDFYAQNLFETFFTYQCDINEQSTSLYPTHLTFNFTEMGDTLKGTIEYHPDFYASDFVQQLSVHYRLLLENAVKNPTLALHQITFLTSAEIQQQLISWNQTECHYSLTTIHHLFELQVEKTPDNIALVYEDEVMTYAELNARANRIAHYLRAQGVGPDTLVGLGLQRSFEMIIGVLAILKAGGAYVPMESTHPDDRLRYMLEDTKVTFLLTQEHLVAHWENLSGKEHIFAIRPLDNADLYADFPTHNPQIITEPQHIAYVIYTSGSTGKPKGVMVPHEGAVNRIEWMQATYPLTSEDAILQKTPFIFDVSVWELLWAHWVGARIVIAKPEGHKDSEYLAQLIAQQNITVMHFVPSMLSAFTQDLLMRKASLPENLHYVFCSGEALFASQVKAFMSLSQSGHVEVHNLYGPTEASIDVTYFACGKGEHDIAIGKPIANTSLYILGEHLELLPLGATGELYLGGVGLARGYLNREELTRERFIWHRFSEESEPVRLYRTGDLVRYLPDGNVAYIGRVDNQIKIRGFRVELEEIESQLLKQAHIANAVVMVKEEAGNKQLIAFLKADQAFDDDSQMKNHFIKALKVQLATFLPDYMIPTYMVLLDKMPVGATGKADRKVLATLKIEVSSSEEYLAPETETEKQLALLWSNLLRISVEKIGLRDNFFQLGGHSLLIMNLLGKIREEWQAEISLKKIFSLATLKEMAQLIEQSKGQGLSLPTLHAQPRPEYIPLSFSQQRLWFLEELMPGKALYQEPIILKLQGHCDIDALCRAYSDIISRHESLRTRFESLAGSPFQVIDPAEKIPGLFIQDASSLDKEVEAYLEEKMLVPFDLKKGPLIRGELLVTGENEVLLFVLVHHIITDGVSTQVYLKELSALYQHYAKSSEALPPLSLQYVDYTLWQRSWLKDEVLQRQVNYWKMHLSDIPEIISLPTDYARPKELTYEGGRVSFDLPAEFISELKSFAQDHHVTLYMMILSAFQLVLHRYSGQKTVVVGSPIANRQQEQLESLIGFFVNTLALKADFTEKLTVKQLIEQIKATTLNAYEHQDIPFEQLVSQLNIPRQTNVNPIFQVMVAYQEYNDEMHALGDLQITSFIETNYLVAKFDLMLYVIYTEEGFKCYLDYSKDLFKQATIERLSHHFQKMLNGMIKQPDAYVHTLPMLSEAEVYQQLIEWNQTHSTSPQITLSQWFEAQVAKTPQYTALVYEDQQMSYQALNARANQIAHALRQRGIGTKPDMLVGLGTERSCEMVIGILAILKAGAAYVPLDLTHPDDRLGYILENTQVDILLTQKHLLSRWKNITVENRKKPEIIRLDHGSCIEYTEDNLDASRQENTLAYVIYTSGSTGQPKGVAQTQKMLVNLVHWDIHQDKTFVSTPKKIAQFASYGFDVSAQEIFYTLLQGATLFVLSQEDKQNIQNLPRKLQHLAIDEIYFPTAVLNIFCEMCLAEKIIPPSLKRIAIAGEALLMTPAIQQFFKQSGIRLENQYGPTESHVITSYVVQHEDFTGKTASIGKTIDNNYTYILDSAHQLLPLGAIGELYLGGTGLARGYLNREDLTVERFIWHHFSESSEPVRLYKTGDLVRYLPDGNIEYVGRADNQIKIRGFRIELGEVEAQLLKQPGVANAAVLVKDDASNKQLVAYLVSDQALEAEPQAKIHFIKNLKSQLSTFLPDYMMPTHIMLIDQMPLNVNGKVDRKALAALNLDIVSSETYQAPGTATEKKLATLWAQLLNVPSEKIGTQDNFFHLGGHSLLIMSLLAKIREEWKAEISLKAIFGLNTLKIMAEVIDQSLGQALSIPALSRQERPEHIPLSFSQQRLWFLETLLPGKALYQVPEVLKLNGHCDIEAFSRAYKAMIARHESLRTRFTSIAGEPVQIIDTVENIPGLLIQKVSSLSKDIKVYLEEKILTPFDLNHGSLIRGELIVVGENEFILFVMMHHIITDGVSIQVYLKELSALYQHYTQGGNELAPLSVQYVDYTLWQRSWLKDNILQQQVNYWKAHLSDIPEMITLPTDFTRPKELTYQGGKVFFDLSVETVSELKLFAQNNQATVFMVMLSALQIVLHRYSGQKTIAVGSPIANRRDEQMNSLIGFFVNTLVLKTDFSEKLTVKQLLEQVKSTTLEAYEHQDTPFEQLVTHLNIARQTNVNPIFQVMLAYQEYANEPQTLGDLQISSFEEDHYPIAKFDLSLAVIYKGEHLHCSLEYSKDLFKQATIERLAKHFECLLSSMIKRPEVYVHELPMLGETEVQQQLISWNQTERAYPETTIHQLFEAQVKSTPNAVALVYENQTMTYTELNVRANQLAHYLRMKGIKFDDLVGMSTDRSFEMIIGILAILKAGAAYVPLDTNYPDDRLQYMLEDTKVKIVLTQTHLMSRLEKLTESSAETACLFLPIEKSNLFEEFSRENLVNISQPNHLAYVIYTSGSTGRPKGVMLAHEGMVNLCHEVATFVDVVPESKVLQFCSMNFDVMVGEWTSTLTRGATLHLLSSQHSILESLQIVLKTHPIEIAFLTPSVLRQFSEKDFPNIKTFSVAGEALDEELYKRWRGRCRFINAYGPTETTVYSSVYIDTPEANVPAACIGHPIGQTQFYILDQNQQLLPYGAIGELYIGGIGLARGYLNRDDLTAEKFIWHRFSQNSELIRLYRTGDLVRYLPEGNVEYMGRVDNQIKIRGYRVELEEIEAQLLKQAHVINAVVIVIGEASNKQLVAYLVSDQNFNEEKENFIQSLTAQLTLFLPHYMIPAHIMLINEMPLNVSGKADRKALAALELHLLNGEHEAPTTETEKRLARLWSQLLRMPEENISVTANFFQLGGHSLLIMNLLGKIREEWQAEISLKTIFDSSSLKEMAAVIQASLGQTLSLPPLSKQQRLHPISLSFSQQRLWFLEELMPGKTLYQVPEIIKLKGRCDVVALSRAYSAMIARHESLRTRFESVTGEPAQVIDAVENIPGLVIHETASLPKNIKDYLEKKILTPFDLLNGPLIRGELICLSENESILFIMMHHIITDGVSMQIYLKELSAFYQHYSQGEATLAPLPVQYVDYTLWQRSWLKDKKLQQQVDYWKAHLKDIPEIITLPTDYVRPQELTYAGGNVSFDFPVEFIHELKSFAQDHQVTLYMVMLSAFQLVLHRYSNQKIIVIGSPIANRRAEQLESLIGFFVNTLALKADFTEPLTVKQLLQQIKATTLNAYEHQDIPFEQLVNHLAIPRQTNVNPIFQVMLAYQEYANEFQTLGDLHVSSFEEDEYPIAKFDLSLSVVSQGELLTCSLEYSKDLFKQATIERFKDHFKQILSFMMKQPEAYIHQLPMLNEAEIQQQLVSWNQTERDYPLTTIYQLFEVQVEQTPDAIALEFEDQQISYRELNARANQIAHYLRKQGIGRQADMLVGLGMERSVEMIIGMLAIVKAGGAYVPMDPAHPDDRLSYMLIDAKITLLLTQEHLAARWRHLSNDEQTFNVIALDTLITDVQLPNHNLSRVTNHNHLAYVLYTSGTTGQPKGVMITQDNLVNLVMAMNEKLNLQAHDKFLALTSMSFDIAELEWHAPLIVGARMILANQQQVNDSEALITFLKVTHPSVMQATPSRWSLLLDAGWKAGNTPVKILVGGEALNSILATKLLAQSDEVWNVYGPTETTIWSSCVRVRKDLPIHIGVPLANTKLYVLNNTLSLLPIGVAGELYIGGVGLARGYLNHQELTEERFIPSPFIAGQRLYKTGDLVRWTSEGYLEYIGRNDFQVKIRGYRIECGEIENVIRAESVVKDVVVMVREHAGEKQLIAYIALKDVEDKPITQKQLTEALEKKLPAYMIPAQMVLIDNMPLNVNGKVDRKALSTLSIEMLDGEEYAAPQTVTEKKLAELWSHVLHVPVEKIGLPANFFHLGGHSLLIMSLLAKIRETWQAEISLKAIFDVAYLQAMAALIDRSLGKGLALPALKRQERPEHIPLSFSQQRLWFLEELMPGKALYQVSEIVKLKGQCNIAALSRAYTEMIARHESLRTRFESIEGQPIQMIDAVENIPGLIIHEASTLFKEVKDYLEEKILTPFNLATGPLIQGELIALGRDEFIFLVVMHHIITDGVSMQVYLKELSTLYQHYTQGGVALAPLSVQYVDYTLWQRSWLKGDVLQQQVDYWKAHLNDLPEVITLPTDYVRPQELTYAGGKVSFDWPADAIHELKLFAKIHQATPFMVILSALQVVLHRYSNQKIIVVGSPIANRRDEKINDLIGYFVNTLALKADFSERLTTHQLLAQVKNTTLNAYEHQDIPFEQLVNHLNIPRQMNVNPVFQVMLAYQEYAQEIHALGDLQATSLTDSEYPVAKFDLTFWVSHIDDQLHCDVEYSKDLFKHATVERLVEHLKGILKGMIHQPTAYVDTLPMLTTAEIEQQVVRWNQTETSYPATTMQALFEAQATVTPDNIALMFEDQQITYRELNVRANQIAHYLREQGVGTEPDKLIGLGTERSVEMIVGMLAIIKTGAAYVPVDPAHPDDRLQYMLSDAKVTLLLTQAHLAPRWESLANEEHTFTVLDLNQTELWEKLPRENLPIISRPEHLAYILYTSGTTGKPKGVMITQHSLVNLVLAMNDKLRLQASDRFLALTSMSFDIAELEWHAPLLRGASMILANQQQVMDIEALLVFLKATCPTVMQATPSRWMMLLEASWSTKMPTKILVGGEALNSHLAIRLLQQSNEVWNVYGPTETTIWSSCVRVKSDTPIHIGEPLANTQLYVLSENLGLLPIGATGELYIGGRGLARGYLNRPELTVERFIPHPFREGERIYKTGDLVRWNTEGHLEYIGRNDFQVKIRGYRIECGEIENVIRADVAVKEVVTLVREQAGDKQLVAYISVKEGKDKVSIQADLEGYLRQSLPHYMIPSQLVILDHLPLNVSGKIDRKALSALTIEVSSRTGYITPTTDTEIELVKLWAHLLRLPQETIGVQHNFFELGGNSLLVIQLLHQVKSRLGIEITIGKFYKSPTINTIVGAEYNLDTSDPDIVPLFVNDKKPVIFLIHALSGFATAYRHLAETLKDHYSVYGINYPALSKEEMTCYDSLESLAGDYIRKIKTIVPQGPYHLGGWSLGGNISLEIAHQLQSNGEEVATLLLMDTVYRYYKEYLEKAYFTVFIKDIFDQFDPTLVAEFDLFQRMLSTSDHLKDLLRNHQAKKINSIAKLMFIKCQGYRPFLASQYTEGFYWSYDSILNGMHHFLVPTQPVYLNDIACGHYNLFDNEQRESLSLLVTDLLFKEASEAYKINDDRHNLFLAVRKGSTYQVRQILAETEGRLINLQNQEGKSLLHVSVELGYITLANFLIFKGIDLTLKDNLEKTAIEYAKQHGMSLTLKPTLKAKIIPCLNPSALLKAEEDLDLELQSHLQIDKLEEDLKNLANTRLTHTLNLARITNTFTRYLDKEFMMLTWEMLAALSPSYALYNGLNFTNKLLMLRLISKNSSALVGAAVMDEIIFSLFIYMAYEPNAPLVNYLNIALARNDATEIGRTLNAAFYLSMLMAAPLFIYGGVTEQLAGALQVDSEISHEWRGLAFTRMIGVLPILMNITLEGFYYTTYQRYKPTLGAFIDACAALVCAFLFETYGHLNGYTLGIALSIGSLSRSLVYLQDCYRQDLFRKYELFTNIPVRLIKQYWSDIQRYTYSYFFFLSNYILTTTLISSENNAFGLMSYAVIKSSFDVINVTNLVLASVSSVIASRFSSNSQYRQILTVGLLTTAFSFLAAGIPSVILSLITGEQLTKLFISIDHLPLEEQESFFNQVRQGSYYFIALSLAAALYNPMFNYLRVLFAYNEIQKIDFVIYFLFCNAAILGTFSSRGTSSLIAIMFAASVLASFFMLYQWLKISDFSCQFILQFSLKRKHALLQLLETAEMMLMKLESESQNVSRSSRMTIDLQRKVNKFGLQPNLQKEQEENNSLFYALADQLKERKIAHEHSSKELKIQLASFMLTHQEEFQIFINALDSKNPEDYLQQAYEQEKWHNHPLLKVVAKYLEVAIVVIRSDEVYQAPINYAPGRTRLYIAYAVGSHYFSLQGKPNVNMEQYLQQIQNVAQEDLSIDKADIVPYQLGRQSNFYSRLANTDENTEVFSIELV